MSDAVNRVPDYAIAALNRRSARIQTERADALGQLQLHESAAEGLRRQIDCLNQEEVELLDVVLRLGGDPQAVRA